MENITYHIDVQGKKYLVTQNYQLADMDRWDHNIRDWLAEKMGVRLGEEHLAAIDFIRQTYEHRKQHPMVRVVAAELARRFGQDKGSLRHFYSLFPKGVHQAVAIAGIPLKGLCF